MLRVVRPQVVKVRYIRAKLTEDEASQVSSISLEHYTSLREICIHSPRPRRLLG